MATILEGSARAAKQVYSMLEDTAGGLRDVSVADSSETAGAVAEEEPSFPSFDFALHAEAQGSKDSRVSSILGELLETFACIWTDTSLYLTQRELALVFTISVMFRSGYLNDDDILSARAMMLHVVLMSECRIYERSTVASAATKGSLFLQRYAEILLHTISSRSWQFLVNNSSAQCDLADMLDGRLFLQIFDLLSRRSGRFHIDPSILARLDQLASLVKRISGVDVKHGFRDDGGQLDSGIPNYSTASDNQIPNQDLSVQSISDGIDGIQAVFPFSNPVIDPHLGPISLDVDKSSEIESNRSMSKAFQELSHWHNHKRPLDPKTKVPLSTRQLAFMYRRDQWFMADIQNYAASLTNSTGGMLEPGSVFVKSGEMKPQKPAQGAPSKPSQRKMASKKGSAQRSTKSKPGGSTVRAEAETRQLAKQAEEQEKCLNAWKYVLVTFEEISNFSKRYVKVNQHLNGLSKGKRRLVEPEILAYLLHILVHMWIYECRANPKSRSLHIVAVVWHTILQIRSKDAVTDGIAKCANEVIKTLQLPAVDISSNSRRPLSFSFVRLPSQNKGLNIEVSPVEFQLSHAGPYLDRSMGSAPDPRVRDFEPDLWQREILDQIDARKSLFVVAPTSAGKTFIS